MNQNLRIKKTPRFSINRGVGHRVVQSYKWRWNVSSWYVCQYLLVVWVSVRAGAWLAVLWSANSWIAKEARGALLAELALCVMQAALEGDTHLVYRPVRLIRSQQCRTSISFTLVLCFIPCRCQSPGGRSPSGRCTRRAHSDPGTNLHQCACIQVHNPK